MYRNMKLKNIILSAILLASPIFAGAQVYSVNFNSKVIKTDELNMPSNTSVYAILAMIPEMLQRSGSGYFENYDVKVNGMSVGDVSNVALHQLQIVDVEKIEISESSISGYTKNGQAGSINIILREHKDEDNKLWGSLAMVASYPTDIAPQALIGFKKGKFQIKGIMLGEFYNDASQKESSTFDQGVYKGTELYESSTKLSTQLARAYMTYKPTANDVLSFNVSENYTKTDVVDGVRFVSDGKSMTGKKKIDVQTFLKYEHQFNRSKFVTELQYFYKPREGNKYYPNLEDYYLNEKGNTAAGKIEYSHFILPQTEKRFLKLAAGCNVNSNFNNQDISYWNLTVLNVDNKESVNPRSFTLFTQPYMVLESQFDKFRMKISAEYQYFNYDIKRLDNSYSIPTRNFTGSFVGEWNFNRHQKIRLILDRKLERPTEDELFPLTLFNPSYTKYVKGNPYLKPVLSHEARLGYISDYRWDEHSLMLDMSTSYTRISNMIASTLVGGTSGGGGLGLTQQYLTFTNDGTSHILDGNFMALYRYRAFSASLTANVYHKDQVLLGAASHHTYFNIALINTFNLDNGWNGTFKIVHNSKVRLVNGYLGDNTHASITAGKRWKNIFIYVFDRVCLQKSTIDVKIDEDARIESSYDLTPNTAGLGIKWNF